MKTKFMMIGYGWRADFFYRIAKLAPEQFEITAGVLRTEERAKEVTEKEGVFATTSVDEALKTKPDFAVLCVPRAIVHEYLVLLMEKGIPVLCETPPAKDTAELNQLWSDYKSYGGKLQVAEQYFLQPYYNSILQVIQANYLGDISSTMISALHGYHAVSVYRKFLNVGFENCTIQGQRFPSPVMETNGRRGFAKSGATLNVNRNWATLHFESGKVGFFDFVGDQYFSQIRTRRWNVQGLCGEINDTTVRYMNEDMTCVEQELRRVDVGQNNISEWSHKGYMLLDKMIYENPFYPARMNDDEIAIASCLRLMKRYVDTGEEFYSLKDALQDAYVSFVLEEAIETGKTMTTENQSWIS